MNALDFLNSNSKYSSLVKKLTNINAGNICINNISTSLSRLVIADYFQKNKETIIYTCDNVSNANHAYDMLCNILGADFVSFFPVEEFVSSELVASSYPFRLARMMTLNKVINNIPQVIVTCSLGITRKMMSKERINNSIIKLKIGDIIEIDELVNKLYERGYQKAAVTEEMGSFSVRGSLIDIYPINGDSAFRINFFDNEIETIKKIDISTQMSVDKLTELIIFPLYDIYYDQKDKDKIIDKIQKKYGESSKVEKDINKINDYSSIDQLYCYLPIIDEKYISFLELFDKAIVVYENIDQIIKHYNYNYEEMINYYKSINFKFDKNFYNDVTSTMNLADINIYLSKTLTNISKVKLLDLIDFKTVNSFEYNNNMKLVIDEIKINVDRKYIITAFDQKGLDYLITIFKSNELEICLENDNSKRIQLIISSDIYGFTDLEMNLSVITPYEYAPGHAQNRSKYQKFYANSQQIYNKDEINKGDYVVHQDYGIGIYNGIVTKEVRGKMNDYLYIQFAEDGKLYVPIENIYLIEKYINNSDHVPKLNSLNGKEWKKKRAAIKEKVIDLAKKLIKVQAERELRKGYIYSKDTEEQIQFENDFNYQETADQLRAIEEVKKDMESEKPVDRLICGDVGFGKTEVAMRAAFKAVLSNKQVAYLAPTTILTRQHFFTFKERFEKYGVRVELINRFVPRKKQTEIIKGLKSGYVDIIIGTHRILSKDIEFKNLGLLIIDEEQRFGVTHKEKIKEIKANVDVLTLTATPIPRTLQMALSGLKDLSIIDTPPQNRLPIQTYVIEENDSVIRDAINREIGRHGQVFYLLNRIDQIDRTVDKIKKLCPDATIGVIHGQMDKTVIENELVNFLDNIYNVLVCTTIIETGIDIPNANTLIIERADMLGLSQLYQIRGRIGRSDRLSYAYLMYNPNKTITTTAVKRLEAIKEFTSLGSGYKIATRDLAIRGAGNILGDEQSGFIDSIGIDLYTKLLNESIDELKGVVKEEDNSRYFNVLVNKHIDVNYVSDDALRIEMHKKINRITSREKINELIAEFTDRYGIIDENLRLYIEEKYLEFLLKSKGVELFSDSETKVEFIFDEYTTPRIQYSNPTKEMKEISKSFDYDFVDKKFRVRFDPRKLKENYIYILTKFLENIKIS